MLRFVSFTLILMAAAAGARADVYRWVDEKGEPHYSDQWVPGSTVIHTGKSRPGSDTLNRPASAAPPSGGEPALGDDVNARATKADVAKAHEAQCTAARDRYMKAIESRRIFKEGKDGSRDYLSDADADAYREGARKDVQTACGSVPSFDPNAAIPEPKPIPEPKVNPADATSSKLPVCRAARGGAARGFRAPPPRSIVATRPFRRRGHGALPTCA